MNRFTADADAWQFTTVHICLSTVALLVTMSLLACVNGTDDPDAGTSDTLPEQDPGHDAGPHNCDPSLDHGNSPDRRYPHLGWQWYYGLSAQEVTDRIDDGFRIVDLEVEGFDPYTFSVAMVENSGSQQKGWWWYYGLTKSQLDQHLSNNNARLIDLEVYVVGGNPRYGAVMIENTGQDQMSNWDYVTSDPAGDVLEAAIGNDQRVLDLDPWVDSTDDQTYSAVMVDNTGANQRSWWMYHGQSGSDVNDKLSNNNADIVDIDRAADGDYTVVMNQPNNSEIHRWWFHVANESRAQHFFRRLGSRIIDVQRIGFSDPEFLITVEAWGYPRTGYPVDSLAAFDREIEQLMWNWESPGASLAIMRHGKLVYARSYGYANTSSDEAVRPRDRFRIASLSKPITKSAIFRLESEGQLSLNDTVFTKHLPDLVPPVGPADSRVNDITIRHLLNHQAGWDQSSGNEDTLNFDPMFADDKIRNDLDLSSPPTCAQRVTYVLYHYDLDNNPGANYAYSNLGYCILGRVIESVTGRDYGDYVDDEILEPTDAGRMRLGRTKLAQQAPDEVSYYDRLLDPEVSSVFPSDSGSVPQQYGGFYLEAMDAHGGWISTPADYVRWADRTAWKPFGPGNWSFGGSLPGSETAILSRDGGDLVMALFLNTRLGSSNNQRSLGTALSDARAQIEDWPCHDLDDKVE